MHAHPPLLRLAVFLLFLGLPGPNLQAAQLPDGFAEIFEVVEKGFFVGVEAFVGARAQRLLPRTIGVLSDFEKLLEYRFENHGGKVRQTGKGRNFSADSKEGKAP